MLPNMNASNISPELLQNLLKLIATAQNQNQNPSQGANQNQNPLTKLALNKPTTPQSSNPFVKTEPTSNPQQMIHRSNNATPSNGQRVQNNDSHPISSKPSPRPSTPKPQGQNMGMRNNSIENRMRPMDKMQTEDNGFIRMQDEPPRTMNFRMNNQQRGPQDTVTVLMVAEKPSIAKAISEALSNGRSRSRRGVSKFCQVHEFHGDFFGQKAFFKVTSVTGHIYVADFPTEYQDWRTVDPHSLFDAPTIKKQANPESQIIEHLQNEAQDATYLVLWLDNDREGENICFEVIDNVKAHMRQENFDQILRVKFSSLVRQDIIEAFHNVNSGPNLNESKSVDARQILDLKIGVAFSRFQTRYLLRRYPNLNTKLVTFGPCQTPTLGFCVERDDEIKNFVSKPFYRIVPVILTGAGERCELTWSNERTFSPEEAQQVKNEIELAREVIVLEVSNKESIKGRPEALNTPHMLKLASSLLGMGPHQTMQVAEKLYQQGYMTYPRTESTSYPQKFDFTEVIQHLCDVPQVSNYCSRLLHNINPPKRGKDAGDHPPITPTLKVPLRANLKDEEWKLYEFIVRHFLATISHDARITNMSVNFQAGKHKLHLKGSHLIDRGFMEITPWVKIAGTEIPEFLSHQRLLLNSVEIKTGKTTPPEHITESDLITLMDKNGIGTDASMAQHINNICERNYVKVVGVNRKLVPTDLGSALIHGYQSIDPDLVAPTLRSLIEQRVDMIAKGQIDYQQVVTEVLAEFSEKFLNFKNNITAMDAVFTQSFGTFDDALAQADRFSVCGKCGDQMLYVEKFHRLHCNNCNLNLTLPQNGKVEIAGDRCCPIDGFQLLVFTSFNQITSYLICPSCSNRSPHPEISARLTCNLCPEAECPYSSVNSELQDCNKCHQGKMILDQQVEDRLTASCNYCSHKILIAQNVLSFQRATGNCPKCSSYLFAKISFNNGKPSCENVCVFCHPEFSGSIMPCETFGENPEQQETRNPRERSFSERRPQERTNSYNNRAPRNNNMEPSLQKGSYKISKMDRNDRNGGGGGFPRRNYNNNNNNDGFRNNNFRSVENRNGGDGMGRPQQQRFPRKNFQNNGGFQNRDYGQNQHNNNFQRRNNGPSWKNNQFQQTS